MNASCNWVDLFRSVQFACCEQTFSFRRERHERRTATFYWSAVLPGGLVGCWKQTILFGCRYSTVNWPLQQLLGCYSLFFAAPGCTTVKRCRTSLRRASSVGFQRDTARITSMRAAIDRYLLPAWHSAAYSPVAVAVVDRWDRRTDAGPIRTASIIGAAS